MPFSVSYAKSLLKEMPNLKAVLENRRYWDPTFLGLYLDHCEDVLFDNPGAGLELAEAAPELALRIPRKSPEEWKYETEDEKQSHRELLVRSFAVSGGAYRAVARFGDAERAYRNAVQHANSGPVRAIVRANLDKRLAKLRSAQGRFAEALRLLEGAAHIFREDSDKLGYADLLNMTGYVLGEQHKYSEAIPYFGRALVLAKGRRRSTKLARRTVFCATHNLAAAVLPGCESEELMEVLRLVVEAKKYQGKCRNTVAKEKLTWVEARIHAKFGCDRMAQRRLISARAKLRELQAPFESALVALELSSLHLQWREWSKLEDISLATFEEFQALSSNSEAIAALRLWVESIQERSLTMDRLRETQATIEKKILQSAP